MVKRWIERYFHLLVFEGLMLKTKAGVAADRWLYTCNEYFAAKFYIVVTVYLGIILMNNKLDAQFLLYTRVGTLMVATIYLQLIQNRYTFRSFTVLQCSHQHCVQPVASDVEVVGYL